MTKLNSKGQKESQQFNPKYEFVVETMYNILRKKTKKSEQLQTIKKYFEILILFKG